MIIQVFLPLICLICLILQNSNQVPEIRSAKCRVKVNKTKFKHENEHVTKAFKAGKLEKLVWENMVLRHYNSTILFNLYITCNKKKIMPGY